MKWSPSFLNGRSASRARSQLERLKLAERRAGELGAEADKQSTDTAGGGGRQAAACAKVPRQPGAAKNPHGKIERAA